MNRFANLADKPRNTGGAEPPCASAPTEPAAEHFRPSRQGRKVVSGYFSPEMSFALHICARRAGISLQELMGEAFNDVLRKYGESPVGDS
ncbi:ribbon-helix-helix domain-containing protein [Novosphingobium sp.]|uniref:ribbon-helix-helix domain-containing protein n=1 Tax=Novosphingobium sp. TaxID=1874826 RepID=UPI0026151E92|nr:ribbon-helix-helix domain-containing protein [Novosphingobium sp.]